MKARLAINADVSRAYLKGWMRLMQLPISPLALALSTLNFGLNFEDLEGVIIRPKGLCLFLTLTQFSLFALSVEESNAWLLLG